MNTEIENDLKRALELINAEWSMQNNKQDTDTRFIYKASSLDECLEIIAHKNVDRNYALHRWYNYHSSIHCEYIFCEFGAIHEINKYNHDVDIYINNIPFDVKLTVYPAALSHRPYDISMRSGRNNMIRWYYANQSQQGRKQLLNRLYVVCDAPTQKEAMAMKCDFDLMRKQIEKFMNYVKDNGVNNIKVKDNGQIYELKSDIILIKK